MVRAMKSIDEPSLPLRVYGPMRSTHRASQGVLITIFDGRCPYFSDRFLFIWQVMHDFVIDRMVVHIPFRYIAAFIVSSRRVCRGAEDSGDTTLLHAVAMTLVLKAFLYCICNFHFQQVEVLLLF